MTARMSSAAHQQQPAQTNLKSAALALLRLAIYASLAASLVFFVPVHAQGMGAQPQQLPQVDVMSTSLLPGLATAVRDVPANVQVRTQKDPELGQHDSLADFLEQSLTGVSVNSAQGNPYQPDVSYRGFTASPLLGLPQGLSVFQDGVRINEPFGDVVNWDLLAPSAISSIELVPGSNPAFGLNTLGGALAIHTKSGISNPGGSFQTSAGSFGRRAFEFEHGGKQNQWDYFLTGNLLRDRGWAAHNPSDVKRFFGKVGYHDTQNRFDLSLTAADNTLEGTQTLPVSFSGDIRQAYTYPDRNHNKLGMVMLQGSHVINEELLLGGNLYFRNYRNQNLSSNLNGNFGEVDPDTGLTNNVQASNDRSTIDQNGYGLGLKLTNSRRVAGLKNQLAVGLNADLGRARFQQESQEAVINASRGADASSGFIPATDATTVNRYYGLFVTDTLAISDRWTLTLAGRYNVARIGIEDRSGIAPKLNGKNSFSRFNPALGLNFNPVADFTSYASYNEGMRTPTPIELTCADAAAPCRLPNDFLSDPPLKKVVARTLEVGAHGKSGRATNWSAAIYRTELTDDIAFISSQGAGTNAGYFQNIGVTRRQGLELAGASQWGALSVSVRYSHVNATYQSAFLQNSRFNSNADASGAIAVKPGDHLPGIPAHNLKFRLGYENGKQWSVGSTIVYSSASYARGDENNSDLRGKVPGYAVVHLDGRHQVSREVELFARVNNLFDRRYANFGTLGRNAFSGPDRSFDNANAVVEQFRGYGAPRGIWVGLRYRWL